MLGKGESDAGEPKSSFSVGIAGEGIAIGEDGSGTKLAGFSPWSLAFPSGESVLLKSCELR